MQFKITMVALILIIAVNIMLLYARFWVKSTIGTHIKEVSHKKAITSALNKNLKIFAGAVTGLIVLLWLIVTKKVSTNYVIVFALGWLSSAVYAVVIGIHSVSILKDIQKNEIEKALKRL